VFDFDFKVAIDKCLFQVLTLVVMSNFLFIPFNEISKVQDPFESSIIHTSKHLKCLISRVLVCLIEYYIWS